MSRLGVILNPTAGHGQVGRHSAEVMMALRGLGHETIDLSGNSARSAAQRAAQVSELDAIIVVGGDGMVNLGVNAVLHRGLPLGIIPLGSGNDAARAFDLPIQDLAGAVGVIDHALNHGGRRVDVIEVVLASHRQWHESEVAETEIESSSLLDFTDPADVRENPEHQLRRYVMCSLSVGFDAAVNQRANEYDWPQGESRYLRAVLSELIGFSPYGYRLSSNQNDARDLLATLITLANTKYFGGGMKIAPDADPQDGKFDVVVAEAVSRLKLLRVFPLIFSGRHVRNRSVKVSRATSIELETWEGGTPPPAVFGDGEMLGFLPLRARIVPSALTLLAPQPAVEEHDV